MQSELSEERSETVALLVREELARRRLSRQWLADEAKVSLSTLEKALAGSRPFTLATVVRLEDALGTSLRGARSAAEPATPGVAYSYKPVVDQAGSAVFTWSIANKPTWATSFLAITRQPLVSLSSR